MRTKRNKNKTSKTPITICIIVTLVFFTAFVCRLVNWQLIHGNEYKELATRSTSYTVKTDATRGEILDKDGEGLVVNTTHYKIVFDKLYIDEEKIDSTILLLINLLKSVGEEWEDTLPLEIYSSGRIEYKKDSEAEVGYLLSEDFLDTDKSTTADTCYNMLVERYKIDKSLSFDEQRNLVSVHYNMELTDFSTTNPYVFAKDIGRDTVSIVSENTQGVSGVDVQTYLIRGAQKASLAPHLLGALGSITDEEYKELSTQGYQLTDYIGKFGIEYAFESELRGEGGTKIIKRNSDGTIVDTVQTIDAKPGNTVYLTLDKKLQQVAVNSLGKNVKDAKSAGEAESRSTGEKFVGEDCETGAVVMLSVKDFSVLAAASYPTYDLNKYSEYGSYYVKLAENKNSPMYNRAFVGSFACGSVYKPCVACAALEEKVIDFKTEIYCKQNYDFYPTNIVRCMHYHGDENVTGAIKESCNYFFADIGRQLGIETMYLYSERFGLGEYTGVEIEESKGTLAGRDSSAWMPGNTVQAAIGQSDNSFTPLQLATYTATLANNGTRLKTHLVSKITNYERTEVLQDFSQPQVVDTVGISQKNLKTVQNAMLEVTKSEDGTAYSMFGDYRVRVGAKTGTAENSGSDHTTFICYAPFEKPEVAIAVVLEHGAKGRYSMQVAKDLLDEYFKNK